MNQDDAWSDLVYFYKACIPHQCSIKISLMNHSAVDVGGMRRQIYTTVYQDFSQNAHVKLFDGQPNHLRPHYSAV